MTECGEALEGFATGKYVSWAEMAKLALPPKVCKPNLAAVQPEGSLSTVDEKLN